MPAKYSQDDYIALARTIHGNRYNYDRISYTNSLNKIEILCPKHGPFWQRPSNHLLGRGCPKCKNESTSVRCKYDHASFLRKATEVHGDIYDYSLAAYSRANQKIEIVCKTHGAFWQTPNSHISNKSGCPRCAGKNRLTNDFIDEARAIHGDKFTYEHSEYIGIKNQVTITCQTHGDFSQSAENHLAGNGCNKCWTESHLSKGEDDLAIWVESLGVEVSRRTKGIIDKFEIDVWIPQKRIGIEFNGYYWHSHIITKDQRKHERKQRLAESHGIRLITVWEFDWNQRQKIVQNHIRHALGVSNQPAIGARTCHVREISQADAGNFYREHHLQGACRGAVENIGIEGPVGLVAAMSFTTGGTIRGKANTKEFELARYATSARVLGGAGKLFSYFKRKHDPSIVWSYSDDQNFTGDMYLALGFRMDGKITADYRVVDLRTGKVWHKSLWQRRHIPARLRELGINDKFDPETDQRTEFQMHDVANVLRVYDSGKTRWLWRT